MIRQMNLKCEITESQKTAVIINGNNLEKYFYTSKIDLSMNDIKDVIYKFKLLDTRLVS